MATKAQINQALKNKGMTQRSWARTKGFNENSVLSFIKSYANADRTPKGKIFREIDELFIEDFGFSIRKDYP